MLGNSSKLSYVRYTLDFHVRFHVTLPSNVYGYPKHCKCRPNSECAYRCSLVRVSMQVLKCFYLNTCRPSHHKIFFMLFLKTKFRNRAMIYEPRQNVLSDIWVIKVGNSANAGKSCQTHCICLL